MGYGIWDMGYGIWDMGYGINKETDVTYLRFAGFFYYFPKIVTLCPYSASCNSLSISTTLKIT